MGPYQAGIATASEETLFQDTDAVFFQNSISDILAKSARMNKSSN